MKIVAIEGGIASGKSTLVEPLAIQMAAITGNEWSVVKEPVDTDPEFHRLLTQFIDNPTDANKRAEFQMYITRSRQALLKDLPDGNYVVERSLFSDLVFTQANMLSTEGPTGAYQASYYDIKDHLKEYPQIDLVVYLDRNPKACFQSMLERDRAGENGYSVTYFEDLHRFHLACLPQIAREYNTQFINIELGNMYANPEIVAQSVLEFV